MKTTTKNQAQAIGLDVGTSRVVMAQRNGEGYNFNSQLNAFVSIPYTKITESALEKEDVLYSVQGDEILVHGNEAGRFAGLLNAELRRTMTHGVLDARDPDSLTVIRQIVSSLTGQAGGEHQKLCFTVPAVPLGAENNLTFHEATLLQILSDFGYEVKSISEGLAVVYSEMENTNFTGIGVSFGGGLCNVAMAYLSVPVLSFSTPKAGDYIDLSAASVTGERANNIRVAKEQSFHWNGFSSDKIQQVLGVYYDEVVRSLATAMKDAVAKAPNLPRLNRPIPLVLSGGTALPAGFRDRFEKILWEQEFPMSLSEVRMASDPLNTTAKGALVAALSDL